MTVGRRTPHLVTRGSCEGIEEALGWTDAWQVRRNANWLVTREDGRIVVRRGDAVGAVLATFPDSTGELRGYASPAHDGSLVAVCGDKEITVIGTDGDTRWHHRHQAWSTGGGSGRGACAWTADGKHIIATVPASLQGDGTYPGDRCVVLDAADGTVVTESVLTAFSAIYEMQQPLAGLDVLLVSAGQGQDDAMSYLVSYAHGSLRVLPAGAEDEPITGVAPQGTAFLKLERGGAYVTAYTLDDSLSTAPKGHLGLEALVGADSEERIVGRPGFVDGTTVVAAVAEEEWAEEARHFLVDADSLRVRAEIEYPVPVGPDPLPLGDGTWLTTSGDEVYRWSVDAAGH